MGSKKILLIEDEQSIFELLKYNLEKEGFQLFWANDGQKGLNLFGEIKPDLVLLDLMLPKIEGLEICKKIRQTEGYSIPIIIITAKDEEIDRVLGLEIGADDYITKPFSIREVLARIKATFRRIENSFKTDSIELAAIKLYPREFTAFYYQQQLELTPKEFALLYYLVQNKNQVITRDEALEKIWGYDFPGDTRTVDVHIRGLRYKLEKIKTGLTPITTIRGIGYSWREK